MKNLSELIVKGQSYTKVNDFKNAIKFFGKANKYYENNLDILLNLAGAYRSVGQFNKSIILYNKMIKIDPINTTAHRLISTLTNYKENSANLILMEKLISKQEIKNKSKIEICFALGMIPPRIEVVLALSMTSASTIALYLLKKHKPSMIWRNPRVSL